jgi:hypothetical protein
LIRCGAEGVGHLDAESSHQDPTDGTDAGTTTDDLVTDGVDHGAVDTTRFRPVYFAAVKDG